MGRAYQSWPVDYSTSAYIIWWVLWLWGVEKLKQCCVHILLVFNFNETTSEARGTSNIRIKLFWDYGGKMLCWSKDRLGCLRVWRRWRERKSSLKQNLTPQGSCSPSVVGSRGPPRNRSWLVHSECCRNQWTWESGKPSGALRWECQRACSKPCGRWAVRDPGPSSRSSPTLLFRLLLQPAETSSRCCVCQEKTI